MPTRRQIISTALAGLALGRPAFGQGGRGQPPYELAYGEDPAQRLDLYPPGQGRGRPIILYLHGGAWTTGDKKRDAEKGGHFGRFGYLFASANYRLSPPSRHPAHIQDAALALAWLRSNGEKYGGDPGRLFVMGHSAGAAIAALLATHPLYARAAGIDPGRLAGAIILDAPCFDLAAHANGPMQRMIERAFGSDAEALLDGSPLHQVQLGRRYPPFLIVHAGARPDARDEALAMQARLRLAGTVADLFEADGKNHRDVNDDVDVPDDALGRAVLRFLERYG